MDFVGLTKDDFEVFDVPGLDARMDALKRSLRPKLEQLGRDFTPILSDLLQAPVFAHVAKHARRTVNPPKDSWVAFSMDKRGYKKHPHFQIGLWRTHLFATFGLIYESPYRGAYAEQLKSHVRQVLDEVPRDFVWIPNHMSPDSIPASEVNETRLVSLATDLEGRNGELLTGIVLAEEEAVLLSGSDLEERIQRCFSSLRPLFEMTVEGEIRV